MHYSMYRQDQQGNLGTESEALWAEDGIVKKEVNARPRLGVQMRVSNGTGRWWQTTEVIEIISEDQDLVVFRTKNSTYKWNKF